MVRGEIALVFFNNTARGFDAKGKTFEQISTECKHLRAGGGTSGHAAMLYHRQRQHDWPVNGIAIVSDGEVWDADVFIADVAELSHRQQSDIPLYYYRVGGYHRGQSHFGQASDILGGHLNNARQRRGIWCETFDLTDGNVDYYSLPNLVQTMRANVFDLSEEILATPLLTLQKVFAS